MKKLFLFLIFLILVSGCAGKSPATRHSEYELSIESRNFYLGVVPTPKSVPETTFDDINDAYREAGEIGEVGMVWVEPQGIGQHEKLMQNRVVEALRVYGIKPIITLSFAKLRTEKGLEYVVDSPENITADLSDAGFTSAWVQEAVKLAEEFKPEYFSLGNEINDYFYLNPDELDSYISLYDKAYAEIKKVSPGTKVFVVFSFTHLIDNVQWAMLERFRNRVDVLGLTSYSWKHHESPGSIPGDYYARIGNYTDKPIAFTEIGWASSNESKQAQFLVRFLELTKDMDLEMINWLFLHEMDLEGTLFEPETGTVALKRADGTKKEIYNLWLDLKGLRYEGG